MEANEPGPMGCVGSNDAPFAIVICAKETPAPTKATHKNTSADLPFNTLILLGL